MGGNTMALITKVGTGNPTIQYAYADYLGSILTVTNSTGSVSAEQNFDAWGRMRNPTTWAYPTATSPLPSYLSLYRGYTGHEQLKEFGLINMNGRMYDPVLGRMLSVDNYTHNGTQGYNRYAYAMNNPLKYTDPSGEFILEAAFIAAVLITSYKAIRGDFDNHPEQFVLSFAITFAAAGVGAGVTSGVGAALAGGSFAAGFAGASAVSSTGFYLGAISSASGGAASGFISGTAEAAVAGQRDPIRAGLKGAAMGSLTGGLIGGISSGVTALSDGRNFWSGEYKEYIAKPELFVSNGVTQGTEEIPGHATLYNSRYSKFNVYYKTESGYYGMRGNRVRPGHYITEQFDGLTTPKGFLTNSVYRVTYAARVAVDYTGNVTELPRMGQPNMLGSVKQLGGRFKELSGNYGWQPYSLFKDNGWLATIPGIGQGWQELFNANNSYQWMFMH
jgi:RHS repeat-associated protein